MIRNYLATPSDAPWKRVLGLYTGWEIVDANDLVIATVVDNTCAKANSILISCAPEMLEALELIHANAGESPEWIRARLEPIISKAKGEA